MSTQNSSNKKSTQLDQSQRSTSISVPKNADCRNQNFDQYLGQFDHALTKINAGKLCIEKPYVENINLLVAIFPRVEKKRLQVMIEPIRCRERMCDDWWMKWPPTLTYIYPSVRVCDTSARASSLHFNSGWPTHILNKFKINVLLIESRWSLDRSCTSPKEESNKNICIFIWASQHGFWT